VHTAPAALFFKHSRIGKAGMKKKSESVPNVIFQLSIGKTAMNAPCTPLEIAQRGPY
jgi:hypothetical protein